MAVEIANVAVVMRWFAGDDEVSWRAAAKDLGSKLANLAFDGDQDWPGRVDRLEEYRDSLRAWLADDVVAHSMFAQLSSPDAEPAVFLDWFAAVVKAWENQASPDEGFSAREDGGAGFDGPFSGSASGAGAVRFDPTRGSSPHASGDLGPIRLDRQLQDAAAALDDSPRQPRRLGQGDTRQWGHALGAGTRDDRVLADDHAARTGPAPFAAEACIEPVWDQDLGLFYRKSLDGSYQYAQATVPGDMSTGLSGVWLPRERALELGPQTPGDHERRLIPIYAVPGWQDLEDEPWAHGWYALFDEDGGYMYLHSPKRTPRLDDQGWSPVLPERPDFGADQVRAPLEPGRPEKGAL